jgi:diguanylate cyclase (GGDEF)-like protein
MLNLIEAVTFLALLASTTTLLWQFRKLRRRVQEQQEQLESLSDLAYYDELTQLPNQTYFKKHLHHAIARAERTGRGFALFYIDLDNFKPFNDQYGHRLGDQVLRVAAKAILGSVREVDFSARLSSDEFVVLLEDSNRQEQLEPIAERILANLRKAVQQVDGEHEISASIGISRCPESGETVAELIDMADHAMYSAKQRGKRCYVFA